MCGSSVNAGEGTDGLKAEVGPSFFTVLFTCNNPKAYTLL